MEEFRKKIRSLHPVVLFILRIAYPILLYACMYFGGKALGITAVKYIQLVFFLIWSATEYLIFFKK